MGTNYYFFTSSKAVKNKYPGNWELTDEPDFGYVLHLAKTSCGWLPLFQAHDSIKSVKDIKEIYDSGIVKIIDEYGENYNWEKFKDIVLEHNGGTVNKRKKKYIQQENNEYYDPNMPNWVPVSHFEYKRITEFDVHIHYFMDDEGYEFCDTEFS